MKSLSNYLLCNRERLGLSQEEVAFLLGYNGPSRGSSVSRDESFSREPGLRVAIAYELIYDRPMRELFAGMYEEAERELTGRARLLGFRKPAKPNEKRERVITSLTLKAKK